MLTAVQADLYLHHLEIQSNNPLGLAKFYSSVMSMEIYKLNNKKFICNGPSRKIIITQGNNKTLSHVGMVCRSERNLIGFKSFLVQNQVQIKEFNSEIYKAGSFSILNPYYDKPQFQKIFYLYISQLISRSLTDWHI